MSLPRVFDAFVKISPVTVMMRSILDYALPKDRIDELFRQHAESQREDELLFSTVVDVLSLVVSGSRRSVNAAYQSEREQVRVSVTSLYNKLAGTEIAVSQALVRETALRLSPVIRRLKLTRPPALPGLRLKILDGNHLAGTEHRLAETRVLNSQPLPGQALVMLDPELMLAIDAFPCEDAYSQERTLLPQVLETVQPNDCLVADRNFCTTHFLFGLVSRKAFFVIRQHGSTLNGKELIGRRQRVGRSDTGVVYEQTMVLTNPRTNSTLNVRRITVELDEPTEDGETEIHILTNVPACKADALRIAEIYAGRWTIENAFQELGQALASEIDTLCYPKAALLCFCVGLVLYNTLSGLKAAIRSAHGDLADNLSGYYLAAEIGATYRGMLVAIPLKTWQTTFGKLTAAQMSRTLHKIAINVDPRQFRKNKRGPKRPPPKRTGGLREKHVSTARILAKRMLAMKA